MGGPGPGFPYVMFMNTHVFRRAGTSFTPASVLSTPGNYFNPAPLANGFHIYGLDWYVDRYIAGITRGRPGSGTSLDGGPVAYGMTIPRGLRRGTQLHRRCGGVMKKPGKERQH